MNICVFGLWHLGSVYSACLAKLGHVVVGLDSDNEVVTNLQNGKAPIFEAGLNELIVENTKATRLSFTSDIPTAIKAAQVVWVTFDTPVNEKDQADIRFIENNLIKIMPYLSDDAKVVISSQAPVGFVNQIEKYFSKNFPAKKSYFACSPENLKLGKALDAFLNPDRIIIGIRNQESKEVFAPLFNSITSRLEWMKIESAEMTKHAINSFLATSVCFANEIASICECVGADAKEVERGLKTESRIGPKAYLGPGVAFSGGTLARDINILIKISKKNNVPSYLINAVNDSNSFHKGWIEKKCLQLLGNLNNKTIAILGLTYKPGTDTLRRSFAVEVANTLLKQGAVVTGYDPVIMSLPTDLDCALSLKRNVRDAIIDADAVIIATEWPEFRQLNQDLIDLLRNKIVIDPNGFIAKLIESKDIRYYSVGRSTRRKRKE
jgi:UDPglucose 6-dehydrogenase